jgi:hypothetical protein
VRDRIGLDAFRTLIWVLFTASVAYALSLPAGGLTRLAFLFSPYCAVAVPRLLTGTALGEPGLAARGALENFDPGSRPQHGLVTLMTVAVCTCLYVMRALINNFGHTIPYVTFWN